MINDKENKLWDDVYKKVVQQYPKKSINFITKKALIIFKKIKNKNPEKYKPPSIESYSSKKKVIHKQSIKKKSFSFKKPKKKLSEKMTTSSSKNKLIRRKTN